VKGRGKAAELQELLPGDLPMEFINKGIRPILKFGEKKFRWLLPVECSRLGLSW
jgi:hypothetical protein